MPGDPLPGDLLGRRVAIGDPANPLAGTVEELIVIAGARDPVLAVRLDRTATLQGTVAIDVQERVTGDYLVVALSHMEDTWSNAQLVRVEIWPIKPTTESFPSRRGAWVWPHAYFSFT